jgi:hypothetical protein
MNFLEFHNHKWAFNLAHARRLLEKGDLETFYRGEELQNKNIYPGMRVMSAYWISVEHEMKMRLTTFLMGAGHMDWLDDLAILAQRDEFVALFLEDMRELVHREKIVPIERIESLATSMDLPEDWREQVQKWQSVSEEQIGSGMIDSELVENWFDSCLRSVMNYNFYLIWGGCNTAALVKRQGQEALLRAVDASAEAFKWEISKEFYVNVMPSVGFEDLGDVMELGMRGMYSDQYYHSGDSQEIGEIQIKHSQLMNCELAGIYFRVAEWNNLSKTALGYGICRYCEAHGEATMQISIPPMYSPAYRRLESLGIDDKICNFELILTPADDMDRLMMVQGKVFGVTE